MRIFVNKSMLDDPGHDLLEGNGVVVFDDDDSVADAISWLCDNYTTLLKHFADLWRSSSWAVVVPSVAAVWVRLRSNSVAVSSCHAWRDASKHGKKARNSEVWLEFDGNHSDAEMIEKAFGKAAKRDVLCCKALGTRLFTVEDGLKLIEKTEDDFVECVSLCDFVEAPEVETAEIPVVTAETRMVESAPSLPAECSAETQEIPEVPPQTNGDAHVLAVSEAVIPGGMSVAEMFPSVPYRAVRAFKRVVAHADGTVSRKKVAYAFRVGDVVQVLRRDRYVEAGADKVVESEIAAYVAKLRQAA